MHNVLVVQIKGDVIRTIRSKIEHIGHIHTAGVPGRHDLDDTQELYYPAIVRPPALEQAFKACEV